MKEGVLQLEHLIGNTAQSYLANIDSSIIYQAGAAIVFHNVLTNTKQFIQPKTKQIQSLDIHKDLIAIGEIGHQPKLHIYNIQTQTIVNSYSGHKYAINFTKFTPDGLNIITVGHQNDGTIIIWDIKSGSKLACAKTSFKITDIKIDPDSKYFVTVGHKHIKFWNLNFNQTITGLSGLLGDLKDEILVSVSIIDSFIYCLTASGLLLMFNQSYCLEKWLDAKMKGTAIASSSKYIIVGGNDGKIRLFEPVSLKHLRNAPINLMDIVSIVVKEATYVVLYIGNLIVFDVDFNIVFDAQHHWQCVWGVSQINDGFCSFSLDGSVKFWDKIGSLATSLEAVPRSEKGEKGVRSFAISPLNNIIACGDRLGTIRIFFVQGLEVLATIEAHDGEIISLDFAIIGPKLLLASASKDRLVHIFDCSELKFDLVQTLDDHTSTITKMLFCEDKLLSCSTDKSIIFRSHDNNSFKKYRSTPLKSTIVDMAFAKISRKIVCISQDRRISFFDIDSGKIEKSFIPSITRDLKTTLFLSSIVTDETGSYCVCSSSDKTIHIIDPSGNSIYQGFGHGVSLVNNTIISTSADGCILIWKIPFQLQKHKDKFEIIPRSPTVFKYDETGLPSWARSDNQLISPELPTMQGKWADRFNNDGIILYSEIGERPVVKPEKPRRFSLEIPSQKDSLHFRNATHPSPKLQYSQSNELFTSIHLVEDLTRVESVESFKSAENMHENPFSLIESDEDSELEQFILEDELVQSNVNRKSISFEFKKNNENSDSKSLSEISTPIDPSPLTTPIKIDKREETRQKQEIIRNQLSEMGINIPKTTAKTENCRENTLTDNDLKTFEALAERTAAASVDLMDKKARESLVKVNRITTEALVREDWTRELLERYSDQIVALIKKKLERE